MDHSTHMRLSPIDLTIDDLEGAAIYDTMDEEVGTVSEMIGAGSGADVIVDVGTFLGMGGKSVAIPVSALNFMRDEDGNVHATTGWSREQIEELPEYGNA